MKSSSRIRRPINHTLKLQVESGIPGHTLAAELNIEIPDWAKTRKDNIEFIKQARRSFSGFCFSLWFSTGALK